MQGRAVDLVFWQSAAIHAFLFVSNLYTVLSINPGTQARKNPSISLPIMLLDRLFAALSIAFDAHRLQGLRLRSCFQAYRQLRRCIVASLR